MRFSPQVMGADGAPVLVVYAPSGSTNLVEWKPVLDGNTGSWQPAFEVEIPATNLWQTIPLAPTERTMFYRARRE